jgi:hypothetical protein
MWKICQCESYVRMRIIFQNVNHMQNVNHKPEWELYVNVNNFSIQIIWQCESYVNMNHMSEWELYVRKRIICENVNHISECETYAERESYVRMWII